MKKTIEDNNDMKRVSILKFKFASEVDHQYIAENDKHILRDLLLNKIKKNKLL